MVIHVLLAFPVTAHHASIDYFFPQGGWEVTIWIVMPATSVFCEEIAFRGYLLRQFSAWTGSVALGVILQAVLFGAAHPYSVPSR